MNDAMISLRSSFIELENGDLLACGSNRDGLLDIIFRLGVGSSKGMVKVPTRIQFIE